MTYSPSHTREREEATACGCREHQALIDAIRLRDAREASKRMLDHLVRLESQLEFSPPDVQAPDLVTLFGRAA
jgi:DNA-binding GntR family transcriptional regulator